MLPQVFTEASFFPDESFNVGPTFIPMDEIKEVEQLEGADLNSAKAVLAFETTRLAHGKDEAVKAYHAATSMFGARHIPKGLLPSSGIPRDESDSGEISVPHSVMNMDQLKKGIPAFKLFHTVGLASSGSASRRLVDQGGAYVNGKRIESFDYLITDDHLNNREILLRSGKKRFHKIIIKKEK